MRLFLDASAMVAMLAREPEAGVLDHVVQVYSDRRTSAVAIWEASRGLAGARGIDLDEARGLVSTYLRLFDGRVVPIRAAEAELALDAHHRFGKGQHPARLNMGDCFAYACTRRHADLILFKGEDFIHTDLKDATLA